MADNTAQRELTAILSADVKGHSGLMGRDDECQRQKRQPPEEMDTCILMNSI